MSPLVTACPGCGTAFRVGQVQLEAADGLVRCGACNAVFDARTHEVGTVSAASDPTSRSIDEDYITGLFRGEPPEEADQAATRPETAPDAAAVSAETSGPSPLPPAQAPTADNHIAPGAEARAATDTALTGAEASAATDTAVAGTPHLQNAELPRIPVELPRERSVDPGVRRRLLAWVSGLLAASLLIALQQLWLGRERHAQNPELRPRYERLCAALGCELPPFRDIRRIRSEGLLVRPDPARPGILLIDASLVNRAAFAQAFPGIRIDFSDIQGTPVTSRVFAPKAYLLAAALREGKMLPGEVLKIHIEMPDPGEHATNYELRLQEPEVR